MENKSFFFGQIFIFHAIKRESVERTTHGGKHSSHQPSREGKEATTRSGVVAAVLGMSAKCWR